MAARARVAPLGRQVDLTVNGDRTTVSAGLQRTLLDLLRDELRLTGTKLGCGIGVCGACSVLVDGRVVSSCLLLVGLLDGADVVTIEGLGSPDRPSPLQEAFVEAGGIQCGICTPGQIVAAHALLAEDQHPSEPAIRAWMAGNLCRCTGYAKIIAAVELAAARGSDAEPGEATAAVP